MKKSILSFFLVTLIIGSLVLFESTHFGTAQSSFQGWQVENGGGQYSQSNGLMSFSGNGGNYITLYEQIAPTESFNFSLQVTAATLQGFAIELRDNLPFAGSTQGVNFEFGARDGGTFSLARYSNGWTWNEFASNIKQNINYTMILSVNKNPFIITATVLGQNGTSLGSYSASDMTNLAFNNINYLGFGVLESGGNYSVKNISGMNISIPARQWIVDSQGNGDFVSIQAAINAAASGDTIFVRNGYYSEHVTIPKPVICSDKTKTKLLSTAILSETFYTSMHLTLWLAALRLKEVQQTVVQAST